MNADATSCPACGKPLAAAADIGVGPATKPEWCWRRHYDDKCPPETPRLTAAIATLEPGNSPAWAVGRALAVGAGDGTSSVKRTAAAIAKARREGWDAGVERALEVHAATDRGDEFVAIRRMPYQEPAQ